MSTTAPVMDYKAGRYKHKDEMRFYTELMLETKAPEQEKEQLKFELNLLGRK